ncbi:MAG: hypothetical protein ACYDCQ_01525 [Dehalococcoidia bacterium]
MRNSGVHRFGGVGHEEISRAYGKDGEELLGDLKAGVGLLGAIDPSEDSVMRQQIAGWPRRLNPLLLRWLEQGPR